jgi:hypothetical protein
MEEMMQHEGGGSYKFCALSVRLACVDIRQVVILCWRTDARALEARGGKFVLLLVDGHGCCLALLNGR